MVAVSPKCLAGRVRHDLSREIVRRMSAFDHQTQQALVAALRSLAEAHARHDAKAEEQAMARCQRLVLRAQHGAEAPAIERGMVRLAADARRSGLGAVMTDLRAEAKRVRRSCPSRAYVASLVEQGDRLARFPAGRVS